jgi:hypothetical protein
MESADYFPPFATGDTLTWDFHQRSPNATDDVTFWDGSVRWTVTGTGWDGLKHWSHVERVLTGRSVNVGGGTADTMEIIGDTSTFIVQDSAGTVTIPLGGSGTDIIYLGKTVAFERLFPTRYGDSIEIKPDSYALITVKRGVGMTSLSRNLESKPGYYPSIPSWSYSRR